MSIYRRVQVEGDNGAGSNRVLVRSAVPGYGAPVKPGQDGDRPLVPGYGGAGGRRVTRARLEVPGYGGVPVAFRPPASAASEFPAAA